MKRFPSGASRRFVATIRAYWNETMKAVSATFIFRCHQACVECDLLRSLQLWDEPFRSMFLGKDFVNGRVAVTRLLTAMVGLDESFNEFVFSSLNSSVYLLLSVV